LILILIIEKVLDYFRALLLSIQGINLLNWKIKTQL